MFKGLKETLKALQQNTGNVSEQVKEPSRSNDTMDILARTRKFSEGKLPKDIAGKVDQKYLDLLLEMAEKESPVSTEVPAGKAYFGATGDRVYYATIDKSEDVTEPIKAIKVYDVTDEEVFSLDNAEEKIPTAEVIYQAVQALSLDSIAYQLLVDLELLKMPEEEEKPAEEPKDEKPAEEKPEEPKEEKPEEPKEEKPEEEEPVKDSVQPPVKEGKVEGEGEPKKDPSLKLDNQSPAKDPAVKTDVKSDAAPVKQGDSSINKDKNAGGTADPNLGKDNVAKEGDVKLDDKNPDKVKQQGGSFKSASSPDPKLDGIKKESVEPVKEGSPAAATDAKPADLSKEGASVVKKSGGEVKQDTSVLKDGEGKKKADLGKDNVADKGEIKLESKQNEAALDVQKPEEYKKAIDDLRAKLEKGEITQIDFERGEVELNKKFNAKPGDTVESVKVGDVVRLKDKEGMFVIESIDAEKGEVKVKAL